MSLALELHELEVTTSIKGQFKFLRNSIVLQLRTSFIRKDEALYPSPSSSHDSYTSFTD